MKTKMIFAMVVFTIMFTIGYASDGTKTSVFSLDEDNIVITVLNEKSKNFEVTVTAKNGDIVYYKRSSKPIHTYQKIFNIDNLSNGIYALKLKVDDTSEMRELIVTNKKIYIGDSKLQIDPFFKFDGKNLKFSYINFDNEKIKLNILGKNGVIFQTKIGSGTVINRGYDLSKLESGVYKVVLYSYNNTFVYDIEKNN